MTFDPKNFYIGIVDLFAILLPGGLLMFQIMGYGRGKFVSGPADWMVLLFGSYLLGHFVFLVGSALLDKQVYDRIRRATDREQVKKLACGGSLHPRWVRRLTHALFGSMGDGAYEQAKRIHSHYLAPLGAASAINIFQWCKARLHMNQPDLLATVQRFEADSKFFRSLIVVLFILIPWKFAEGSWKLGVAGIVMFVLALWRYIDQRMKATRQAYWYVITTEAQSDARRLKDRAQSEAPDRAGGVAYRYEGNLPQFLLVQAKKDPGQWVLPKGHVEPEETERETAVREVREESGVWARVCDYLGENAFNVEGEDIAVAFYLMESLEQGEPDEQRKGSWFDIGTACDRATHDGTIAMLRRAAERVPARSTSRTGGGMGDVQESR